MVCSPREHHTFGSTGRATPTRRFPPPWPVHIFQLTGIALALDRMTLTTIPCLLYFAALFLPVATLWILLYPNEGSSPQDFFVMIVVVMPFVMLVYFGLAVIICDNIGLARGWSTALPLQIFSRAEGLAAAVTYIGLTAWLWLRWRKLRNRQRGILRGAARAPRGLPRCSRCPQLGHLRGI